MDRAIFLPKTIFNGKGIRRSNEKEKDFDKQHFRFILLVKYEMKISKKNYFYRLPN